LSLPAPPDRQSAARLYALLSAGGPPPRPELEFGSPFQLLVAVVLSAQATDKSVNLVTRELFASHGTPRGIVELGEEGLRQAIRTIGLAPTKARNLVRAAGIILERHSGQVPRSREELEELPGVGRKSANVILNVAFGQPTLAVDTHVFRVANRTGLAPGKTVGQVEERLLEITPPEYLRDAHHLLILHGRYVCKARRPDCPACVISVECRWPEKTAP